MVYYGDHIQDLITEFHKENPIDPITGEDMSMKKMIENLHLDKELIKWSEEDEDFKPFSS